MAPTRDRNGDSERAAKRKRDKAETEEERRNRKKQKSKRQSLLEQNGQQDHDDVQQSHLTDSQSQPADGVLNTAEMQIVHKEESNGQFGAVRSSAAWNVSKPIGGRMLDIDPVFSVDEL